MAEAEKRESSVLFSLRELQQIEEDRVSEEELAEQRAKDAEVAQKAAEEQARRDAAAAEQQAKDEAERSERERRERLEMEERARVQQAEAQARIEQQSRLDQERLAQEMELRRIEASKKRPTALIAAAVVLLGAVGGLGYYLYDKDQKNKEQEAALKAERERVVELERQQKADQRELDSLLAQIQEAQERIAKADTDSARKAASADLARYQKKAKNIRKRQRDRKKTQATKKPKGITISDDCANNPLCNK